MTPTSWTGSKNAKALQILGVKARGFDLADDDVVGFLEEGDAVGGNFARIRTARPGPGNGWRERISSGMPMSRPIARNLVL